jgi:glutaredoxin-like protein NrdH
MTPPCRTEALRRGTLAIIGALFFPSSWPASPIPGYKYYPPPSPFNTDTGMYIMAVEHVNGKDKGTVILYALSTCGWCAKTKDLLRQIGVAFDYTYVDLLDGKEQDDAMNEVEKFNSSGSFPTLVIDNRRAIVGFREDEIREALGA